MLVGLAALVHAVEHLRCALAHAGLTRQALRRQLRHPLLSGQRLPVAQGAQLHIRRHQSAVKDRGGHGEQILVAAALPVQLPQQLIQGVAQIVSRRR